MTELWVQTSLFSDIGPIVDILGIGGGDTVNIADNDTINCLLQATVDGISDLEGRGELMISDARIISSLSRDWVEAVKSSGRFGEEIKSAIRW